jgi:DNA-3-methyladenine glycosylase II
MTQAIPSFTKDNFQLLCVEVAKNDKELRYIINEYGYPPMWTRPANYSTLIHIILEQQVSLASAKAAFLKLKDKIGSITPQKVIALTDEQLRACYFSRQKRVYVRHLAEMILQKKVSLTKLSLLPDDEIRSTLKQVKGIGDWTVDVYLLFALQRQDLFPTGDLAMMNAFKEVKGLSKNTSKEQVIEIAEKWRPYRSIATMLLWHYYIQKKGLLF